MPRAWIGLGSNLDDPPAQLRRALARLAPVKTSRLWRSAPIGVPGQPEYCNAACEIETDELPAALLARLRGLEQELGRAPSRERWAPRRIDLDIVHYEGVRLDSPMLVLPHPEAHKRNFVIVPLAEIAPGLELPGHGRVDALAEALGRHGLEPWPN